MTADPSFLAALATIEKLRAALKAAKWRHAGDGPACPATYLDGACDEYLCGADEHNARIDAALQPAEGEGELGELLANAFKWLMDAHVIPALRADLNVLSVLDMRVLASEYAAMLGREPSPAPPEREECVVCGGSGIVGHKTKWTKERGTWHEDVACPACGGSGTGKAGKGEGR